MRRFAGGAALVLLLSVATTRLAVADFFSPLSPLLAPVMGSLCKAVACGKGNCTETSGLLGYRCDCDPGWTQMHVGDDLRFLPCVIPNCTIDRSCSNDTSAPSPAPSPKNFSLSPDPCELAYCGSGGTCKNGTGLSYHCECKVPTEQIARPLGSSHPQTPLQHHQLAPRAMHLLQYWFRGKFYFLC
ncbi:hypothetical protein ACQ4PT_026105 [Festuca glaucescens]